MEIFKIKLQLALVSLVVIFITIPGNVNVSAQSPYSTWDMISYKTRNPPGTRSTIIHRPPKAIKCPEDLKTICKITLNITHMLTMTLYEYDPLVDRDIGGWRGQDAYAVDFVSNRFRFSYADVNIESNRKIKFLYPIIGDGYSVGSNRRTVIAINNQLPGPTIIGRKGQRMMIKVINGLESEAVTIHWHGQHMNGNDSRTPWMDGVPMVTQCHILPFTEFTYDFVPDQAGTHWYHSHSGAQRTEGLFGALVITDKNEYKPENLIDRPEDHTITLFDWQHSDSLQLFGVIQSGSRFQEPLNYQISYVNTLTYDGSESAPFPFVSGIINGAGWYYSPISSSSCTTYRSVPLSFFEVVRNQFYRFRIVGAQNSYAYRFSIQNHKMILLATDGTPVKIKAGIEVDFIIVHTGERYDFMLNATQATGIYWMVAETLEDPNLLSRRQYLCTRGRHAYSILYYKYANLPSWPIEINYSPTSRCSSISPCVAVNCPFKQFPGMYGITCINVGDLELIDTKPIPNDAVSESVFLNFGFGGIESVEGSAINGRHFETPPSPLISHYGDLDDTIQFCDYGNRMDEKRGRNCIHRYKINSTTTEMVFMNFVKMRPIRTHQAHPVHLHGHHFHVVYVGYGNCSNDPDPECIISNDDIYCPTNLCDDGVQWANGRPFNTCNELAPMKDTVIVPPGGYVVIRFTNDNPGWWFLHCHIEPHLLEGMAMVIEERREEIPAAPVSFPQCGNFPIPVASTPPTGNADYYLQTTIGVSVILALLLLSI